MPTARPCSVATQSGYSNWVRRAPKVMSPKNVRRHGAAGERQRRWQRSLSAGTTGSQPPLTAGLRLPPEGREELATGDIRFDMGKAEGTDRESGNMRARPPTVLLLTALLAPAALLSCTSQTSGSAGDSLTSEATLPQEKGGEEEFGPYEPVGNWPQPLVDHDGWTWGSTSGVYAETPDRIWIAQRGELPLPPDAAPFTTYGMLTPPASGSDGDAAMGTQHHRGGWRRSPDPDVAARRPDLCAGGRTGAASDQDEPV